jgi:ribulose 1,5-bisphosphate synthetase/thiazole synthase
MSGLFLPILDISRANQMTLFYQNIKWQQEADSIFDNQWNVVIAGAGPAGATAAAYLAAKHHQVLLLDRKKFPREKIY